MTQRAPEGMRSFTMCRQHDSSGVSGTGTVLEGVLFSTGVVVIHWLTPPPRGSISVFDSIEQFLSIHVRPHPDNHAVLSFMDGEELICLEGGGLGPVPAAPPSPAPSTRPRRTPVS